ncbi:MAG: methyltransferase domain-containing protein [Acidimicrobiia bacterium]|nr:methyltransferase domain-containing protein [Acidimicrobiia bacterium]
MDGAPIDDAIADHYERISEQSRLRDANGRLEEWRTRDILMRHLPPPPAVVLDIGGAAGVYAHWLTAAGYTVHLRDPMAKHIDQAIAAAEAPLASAGVGDARHVEFDDRSADAVLLLGPLYHLTETADRHRALGEAYRVLRPGGVVFAVGVSRFASALDGLWRNLVADPVFREIVDRDLAEGQHRNPTGDPTYWTTAYLHHPDELPTDLEEAGFLGSRVLAVEGIGWIMPDLAERWAAETDRKNLLEIIARTETEPSLLGVSPHLMAVGWVPESPV